MAQPSRHIPENVGLSRLMRTSPPSEWQTPGPRVNESNPPVPHDSLAGVQREWGSTLNPDALNKCPGILRLVAKIPLMATLSNGFVFETLQRMMASNVLARLLS